MSGLDPVATTGYDPKMRRSISLNLADAVNNTSSSSSDCAINNQDKDERAVMRECQKYLEDNPTLQPDEEEDNEQSTPPPQVNVVAPTAVADSPYGTLPRPVRKNVGRSLVPKMRKMFEKARSCEPGELPQIRIRLQTEPPAAPPSATASMLSTPRLSLKSLSLGKKKSPSKEETKDEEDGESSDGTESVSSFVAVSSMEEEEGSPLSPAAAAGAAAPQPPPSSSTASVASSSGGNRRRGFVNKCVMRLQNMMHVRDDE